MKRIAPTDVILSFLAQYPDAAPWVPISAYRWHFTTTTFRELLTSGRMEIHSFNQGSVSATLDDVHVYFVQSLYDIVLADSVEILPTTPPATVAKMIERDNRG